MTNKEENLQELIIDITTENGFKYTEKGLQLVRTPQRTNEWLKIRQKCITATDATFIHTTFIEGKKHYKKTKADFFDYKHGISQKEFSSWEVHRMKKGELTEVACESIVEQMCLKLDELSGGKKNYTYLSGISYIRDGWAMASTDYMIFEDEKIHSCVEIKNTDSKNIFEEYRDKIHPSFAQLSWQMKVTGAVKGMIICCFQGNIKDIVITKLDLDSPIYKSIEENYPEFKYIHEKVCVKKENPCSKIVNELNSLTDEVLEIRNRLDLFKEQKTAKQKKLDALNKTVKQETEMMKEFQKAELDLSNKYENLKNKLRDKCVKEGIYSTTASTGEKLIRKTVKGVVCMAKYSNCNLSNGS